MSTPLPETQCPNCGATLSAAGIPDDDDATPEPGSVLLCIQCLQPLILQEDLTPRLPTTEEAFGIAADEDYMKSAARLKAFNRWRSKLN